MKKIIQTLKLRKFKTQLMGDYLEKYPNEDEWYVLYKNMTFEYVYFKDDLIRILQKDHIKPIMYIFNATDRIVLERNIKIDLKEVEKDE